MKTLVHASAGLCLVLATPAHAQSTTDAAALAERVRTLEAIVARLEAAAATNNPPATKIAEQAAPATVAQNGPAAPGASSAAEPTARQGGVTAASTQVTGAAGDGFRVGSQTVKLGGWIRLDAMYSAYNGGNPAASDPLRLFLLPGTIPIGGPASKEVDFSARNSRLWLTTSGDVAGHKVDTRVEVDFLVAPGTIDRRTTNPVTPALRRAFVTVDEWLFGQEYTNFQDAAAFPESADYTGPASGTQLVRQAQLRYTKGPWSVSVESPETTLTPFAGGPRIATGDSRLPDFTARYDVVGNGGFFSVAGLVRQLSSDAPTSDDRTYGWGLSVSGKIATSKRDDIRFQLNGGRGIGRYVGINFANDAVIGANGQLNAIPLVGGFIAYRHFWSPTLRSSLIYAGQKVFNKVSLTGRAANEYADDAHINLVWSPFANLDVGAEYIRATRTLEDDSSGRIDRLATFFKYGF